MAMNPASIKQHAPSGNLNPAFCLLPSAHHSRGFALLVAVIFMSVMLAFGLALGSLAYKQQVLASVAIQSQYAFYAADAALECALRADQKDNRFPYPATSVPPYQMQCDGAIATYPPSYTSGTVSHDAVQWVFQERISLNGNTRCADVTIYKLNGSQPGMSNYIFAQGYNIPCSVVANPGTTRFVARGISVRY
jgi:hypothetical protein